AAELGKGVRGGAAGVARLSWGLVGARRLGAGLLEDLRGAEQLAQTKLVEARVALVETQQGIQQVDKQIADVQEQLLALLDLPLCTPLELVEPELPLVPFHCCDDAVALALSASP